MNENFERTEVTVAGLQVIRELSSVERNLDSRLLFCVYLA